MSPALRQALLKGFQAADKVHRLYDLQNKLSAGKDFVDVFELIKEQSVSLCFRKLDNLYGAYLPIQKNAEGILINSEHPLHTQRYTAAHELGHHFMGHKTSFDASMIERAPIFDDGNNPANDQMQEKEADSFASALLMPRWLIINHLNGMKLTFPDLRSPDNIYQLSIRLAAIL